VTARQAEKGAQTRHERRDLPDVRGGARLWQATSGAGMHYLPYFYNPHLDPSGRYAIYCGDETGSEQAYLLDFEEGVSTQLTAAQGRDQHWSPYIRQGIDGIRPQFIAWTQPDWEHVLFWEDNTLKRVHVRTLAEETLYEQRPDTVPQVLHCSQQGLVAWGYIQKEIQEDVRRHVRSGARMEWSPELLSRLEQGGGFVVFDLRSGEAVLDVHVPFWVNHIQASPDGRFVLFCQEGPWQRQRMWLYHVAKGEYGPLRPQEEGVAIGHEFWLSETEVGYHGSRQDKTGFFGRVDVQSGEVQERPAAEGERFYGHYHASPDGRRIVTDGEVAADWLSIATLDGDPDGGVTFEPVARHGWVRSQDQRHHPHPHWHLSGSRITFTGCETDAGGQVSTHVLVLDLS
jgi:oligogalacturonide lyase